MYASAYPLIRGASEAFRPPRRVSVSQGAADSLVIRQPGGYSGPWAASETPYMAEPMDMLASRHHEAVCFVGPARTGKCLDIETPIPVPGGWSALKDIRVGSTVFGPDGKPAKVLFVSDVKVGRPCFRVTFSDGSELIADDEHRWGVERFYWNAPNWRYEVKTTAALIEDLHYAPRADGGQRFRYRVRNTESLQMPHADLPLDPYLLGLWLGDGSSGQAAISAHREDAAFYAERLQAAGHAVKIKPDGDNTVSIVIDLRERLTTHCQRGHAFNEFGKVKNGACKECLRLGHWRRKYGHDRDGNKVPPLSMFAGSFASKLHALGVHGAKHIPPAYLRASAEQRWELLRGLMDTDGSFDRRQGRCEFTSVSQALTSGFLELARSLGLKPTVSVKATTWTYKGQKKSGSAFRVGFPVAPGVQVFSLLRKRDGMKAASIDVGYRQIVSIEPVDSQPVMCIQVDNASHLFLAGEGMVPTHNTLGLLDGWLSHCVTADPGDMLIIQMSQEKAREFSKTRVDRAIRNSPKLQALMSMRGHDDNTHDKLFRHGMWVKIGWPSASQLSSSDYRYTALTDYDRMPDDIDGEGAAYGLALKRTQTFLSRGMCMVESSPGRDLTDPFWEPSTSHEAPPVTGILGIYNRGDRRRWFWKCPDCSEHFEAAPGLKLFSTLPPERDLMEEVRTANLPAMAEKHANVICPHCGSVIEQRLKPSLNSLGRWLIDGQTIDSSGEVSGDALRSSIASYWLGGVAAAYQRWDSLILRYLQGLREYALSGSLNTLKTTINTDQGMPFLSPALAADAEGAEGAGIEAGLKQYIVPAAARFLVATVDVQGGSQGRFVCEVRAFGRDLESWLVDRFSLTTVGEGEQSRQVEPAAHPEDWDLLTSKLVRATYRLEDGREMRVLRVGVDTGGEAGTTHNAYAWYRRLRKAGESTRVRLLKGGSHRQERPMVRTNARSNTGQAMLDMPIWLLDTVHYKDIVASSLRRKVPGPLYFHRPGWVPAAYWDELRAEVRTEAGKWQKIRKRNEALDLWAYALALCEELGFGAKGRLSWDSPPSWALPQDAGNTEIVTAEERRTEHAAAPAVAVQRTPPRRATQSTRNW